MATTHIFHPAADSPMQQTTLIVTDSHVNAGLLLLGRLLFGGFFVFAGLGHFLNHAMLAGYAAQRGVPQPDLAVYATGSVIVLAGFLVLAGIVPRVGAALIAIFLIAVTPTMHAFWNDPDPAVRAADLGNFTKNIALLGACGFIGALGGPWPLAPHRHHEG